MLVHFAVDTDDLGLKGRSPIDRPSLLVAFFREWERFGVLQVDGSSFESSAFRKAVEVLPVDIRKLWEEAILQNRLLLGPNGWPGVSRGTLRGTMESNRRWLDLVAVCDECAISIGLVSEQGLEPTIADGLETLPLACAHLASCFQQARKLSEESIQKGDSLMDVWSNRFAAVAAIGRNIKVIDRYALPRMVDHSNRGGETGLGTFLRLVQEADVARSVKVFSTISRTSSVSEYVKAVELELRKLPHRPFQLFEVHIVKDKTFLERAHDRVVMFDDWVYDIGLGLEPFEGEVLQRDSRFHFSRKSRQESRMTDALMDGRICTFCYLSKDSNPYAALDHGFLVLKMIE